MIDFLKEFFTGEKKPEPKKHDVLVLDAYAMDDEDDGGKADDASSGCGSGGGCGGCGCG